MEDNMDASENELLSFILDETFQSDSSTIKRFVTVLSSYPQVYLHFLFLWSFIDLEREDTIVLRNQTSLWI